MSKNIKLLDINNVIDENSFLDYEVAKVYSLNPSPDFHAAIERLADIREVLFVAKSIDKLQQIGNWPQYMEALKWLRGEAPLYNFIPVPQISAVPTITQSLANQFNQYTQQLQTILQNEMVYGQIEVALKVAPTLRAAPVSKQVQQAGLRAEKSIEEAATVKTQQIVDQTANTENQLRNIASELQQNFNSQITNERQNATNEIRETLNQATRILRTAESLNDWGGRYDQDIQELEYKIYGIDAKGVLSRNLATIIRKIQNARHLGLRRINWLKMLVRVIYLIAKNLLKMAEQVWSNLSSIAGRRTLNFIVLSLLAASMVLLPLLSQMKIIHIDVFAINDLGSWLTKIGLWLPLVVILSIGYSFTTKNYRIYSNMLDQYKHRRAVARTAQGIILGANGTEEGKELRAAMTAAAASALFEHKITGHLSKKEVESFGVFDVIRSIGGK